MATVMKSVTSTKLFDDIKARIIGGEEVVDESDYPWYIRLEIFGQLACGGSLLHPLWVLTAAHCFRPTQLGPFSANHWINKQVYDTFGIEIHPEYREFNDNGKKNFFNDIMLVQLSEPIPDASLVSLNNVASYPSDGQELTVIGLGKTDEAQLAPPNLPKLLETQVNAISNDQCQGFYDDATLDIVEEQMLCAGVDQGGKDSCEGDSGGPLLDAQGVQVGIVSFGVGCGLAQYPGVYSRVSNYMEWIESVLCADTSIYADAGVELPTMCVTPTTAPTPEPTPAPVTPEPTASPTTPGLRRREPRENLYDFIPLASGFLRTRSCVDEDGPIEVDLGDLYRGTESCAWLRDNEKYQPRLCLIGTEADRKCRRTCENCAR